MNPQEANDGHEPGQSPARRPERVKSDGPKGGAEFFIAAALEPILNRLPPTLREEVEAKFVGPKLAPQMMGHFERLRDELERFISESRYEQVLEALSQHHLDSLVREEVSFNGLRTVLSLALRSVMDTNKLSDALAVIYFNLDYMSDDVGRPRGPAGDHTLAVFAHSVQSKTLDDHGAMAVIENLKPSATEVSLHCDGLYDYWEDLNGISPGWIGKCSGVYAPICFGDERMGVVALLVREQAIHMSQVTDVEIVAHAAAQGLVHLRRISEAEGGSLHDD